MDKVEEVDWLMETGDTAPVAEELFRVGSQPIGRIERVSQVNPKSLQAEM